MRADRRTCTPEPSSMDRSWGSGDWNRRPIPESVTPGVTLTGDSGRSSYTAPRGKDDGRPMGGCRRYKSVTMAPASMYLSGRRYVARRPLFASDQHTSILKKTNVQDSRREDWPGTGPSSSHQHAEIDVTRRYTSLRHTETPTGLPVQHSRHTFLADSSSREDLSSPLGVSDLKEGPSLDESAFASPFLGEGSDRGSLSSPSPEVHSPGSPPSPRLSSTRLPASINRHLGLSGPLWSDAMPGRRSGPAAREGEGRAETYLTKSSSTGYLQRQTPPNLDHMSPHQANYWACAIPPSLPPSPDRQSPSWDPDREYQALLDYTYPLRPGRWGGDREDPSKPRGSLLRKGDRGLQDSGIELDGFCSSNSLGSGLDLWFSGTGKSHQVWPRNGGHGLPRSWDSLPQVSPLPPHTDPVGYSLESLDSVLDPAGGTRPGSSRAGRQPRQRLTDEPLRTHNSSPRFGGIRSTSLLFPRPRGTSAGDWDEEFRPLPDQLEELQSLAKQVREVTATLCRPLTLTGGWEGLESGDPPCPQIPQARQEDQEEVEKAVQASHLGHVRAEETPGAGGVTGGVGGGVNGAGGGGGGQTEEPAVGAAVSQAALREVEALVEQLSGVCLQALRSRGPAAEQVEGGSVSLMQRIQVFCANLEQLIGWLYSVAHKMEALAPPTADLESVKASFAQYQSFQKEVTSHRPLASSVLHTGQLLLNCLDSTSPVLRDTLVLIERQTKALESNTENLFSAILSAMDSLAQGQTDRSLDTSTDRPADRQVTRHVDRQTRGQTDRSLDTSTDRPADRQTD